MRSSVRATYALSETLALQPPPTFVCRSCRHQAYRQHITFRQESRSASSKNNIPFTEKVRRKIWGTDNPPGLADPYGGPSFLERRRMKNKEDDNAETNELEEQEYERQQELEIQRELEVEAASNTSEIVEEFDEPASEDLPQEYIPAQTWDGLEHVGHQGYWADMPPKPEDSFKPFAGNFQKPSSREYIYGALHRAFVEVLTLQPDQQLKTAQKWISGCPEAMGPLSSAKLVLSTTSSRPKVEYATAADEEIVATHLKRVAEGTAEDNVEVEGALINPLYPKESKDVPSGEIDLTEPWILNVLNRFVQLTGQHIPDPVLQKRRWSTILDHVARETVPKPKNLAERLMQKETLANLPNLKIMGRRETPVDKEKEVGRWKVIEEELTSRGLPVLGRARA